ncbi:MAG: DUF945 family protein [Pseudomonadota bacterium]
MKKLLIALAVLLVIILGSPAVIGSVAEDAVQDNLGWVAGQAGEGEVDVTVESYEKGWFSSTIRYRLGVSDGQLQAALLDLTELLESDALPALVIETKLDHGVLPLSTLKPGLGSAFSTITLDTRDNEYTLPGTVVSQIGFGGQVDSVYALEAGTADIGESRIDWAAGLVEVSASPSSGRVIVNIDSDGLVVTEIDGSDSEMTVGKITISADQEPSAAGFYIGTTDFRFESIEAQEAGVDLFSFGPLDFSGTSVARDELMDVDLSMSMDFAEAPMVGDVKFVMQLAMNGFDGVALESLSETLSAVDDSLPPDAMYMMVEDDLMTIFETGFVVDMSELDVDMDLGRSDNSLSITVPPMEPGFTWPAVLQAMTADANVSVPATLMDMAIAMNPQVNAAIASGILQRNGDNYEMAAQYEKGLVTVNGAPFPLPFALPADPGS